MRTSDPASELGVYETLDDVPDHHRLSVHSVEYTERDIWAEWIEDTDTTLSKNAKRGIRYWNQTMDDRGDHPALATPDDVAAWADKMQTYSKGTLYNYARPPFQLYRWLLWHTDHPHTYNPLIIAAVNDPVTHDVYDALYNSYSRATQDS